MKTDMELQKDVIEELKWEPRIKSEEIGVSVRDAERAAWSASGVTAVEDRLAVVV